MSFRVPRWRRRRRNLVVFGLLAGAILTSYVGAFALKLGTQPLAWAPWFGLAILPVLIIKLGLAWAMGLHRGMWRYADLDALVNTTQVVGLSSGVLAVIAVALPTPEWLLALVIQDFLLSLLCLGAARMSPRIFLELGRATSTARRVVVLGAGDAGEALVRELKGSAHFHPVAILDDDATKHGKKLHGVPVVATLDEMGVVAADYEAEALLLAIYAVPGERLRQIRGLALETGLPLKRVPAMAELLAGRARIDELHDFSLEVLLDREPIRTDRSPLRDLLTGRCALITGAAGSIGSELSRQVLSSSPARLILLDHDENALFHLERELRPRAGETVLVPTLCSVRDANKLRELFAGERPEVIFHAAAYKHVPVLEQFPEEAVRNNVRGTLHVATLADEYGADRFVLISTDKAVRPTSVMGTTKRVAELLVADIGRRSRTMFSTIRFGNVLGSNGSVMQLFRRQIAAGGPVTITHPEMRRFFMSIPEAVELVLFAAAMDREGGTFILNMGEQVRILDLARHFIRLHGLEPERDIPIEITGLRPGEKLYEELWVAGEEPAPTEHPDILRAPRDREAPLQLDHRVATLLGWADAGRRPQIIQALRELVPSYTGEPVCAGESARRPRAAARVEKGVEPPEMPVGAIASGDFAQSEPMIRARTESSASR